MSRTITINIWDCQKTNWLSYLWVNWSTIGQVFDELWPEIPKPIVKWTDDINSWGKTLIPDDGSNPIVLLDIDLSIHNSADVLAHQLAHVACHYKYPNAKDNEDGPEWKECFEDLYQKYWEQMRKLNTKN